MLERCAVSVFKRTDIDDAMTHVRDDVIFAGRGAMWLRYENEDGEQKVCVEHKDRLDFLHERSEEHTSELQSLMRISYAVFCLKKKKKKQIKQKQAQENTAETECKE